MEIVAEGLAFPEGPIALLDGGALLVEIESGHLARVGRAGQVEGLVHLGGGPNGAAVGPEVAVYVCNNGSLFDFAKVDGRNTVLASARLGLGGSIQHWEPKTGAVQVLYNQCDGRKLYGPNDIAFDSAGGFWFIDNGAALSQGRAWGALYYASVDGSRISRFKDHLLSANSVGLSPDEKVVFFADTLFNGGITTTQRNGLTSHLPTPDILPTNLCFGCEDMRDARIMSSGLSVLYQTRWTTPGLRSPLKSLVRSPP